MGSTYFPAPSPPTFIEGPDGVPLSGTVQIIPGNNQQITRAGQVLTVVGTAPSRARSMELFIPGVIVARNVLVVDGIPNAVLTQVDAMFETASPGAGAVPVDNTHFGNLHIAGGSGGGGPVDFPFNVQGVAEWHLGTNTLSQIAGQSGTTPTGGNTGINRTGVAQPFTPTTNLTVGGIAFAAASLAGIQGNTGPIRIGIATAFTSASGKTAATTPWTKLSDGITPAYIDVPISNILPGPAFTTFQFPVPINLVSGTTYVLVGQNQQVNAGAIPIDTKSGGAATNMNLGQNFGTNAGQFGQGAHWDTDTGLIAPLFQLIGSVGGTPFNMPVTVSTTLVGAPTNPGTDLLVSLQF